MFDVQGENMQELISSIELITPSRAQELLSRQIGNRTLNRHQVEYLAREILSGNWKVTHQGICLGVEDDLLDGQHRLAAVVKAGRAVRMMVTRNLDREAALRAVDQGKIRSRGQLLSMRGERNAVAKASICRSMSILLNPDLQYSASLGPAEDVKILERYREAIELVLRFTNAGDRMSARFNAVAALFVNAYPDIGEAFVSGVTTGEDLSKGDPRLTLRNWLLSSTANRMSSSADGAGIIARTACVVAAYYDNESLQVIKPTAHRYVRYCNLIGVEVNRSLFAYCGGKLLPDPQKSASPMRNKRRLVLNKNTSNYQSGSPTSSTNGS